MTRFFTLALFTLAFFTPPALADNHQHASKPQGDVQVVNVTDGIHLLISPMGGNVTVATGKDGTFIIDDQLSGRSQIIEDAIKTLSDAPVKFVLNTHYHFDHSGGNEFFGEKDAIIVAHHNVRKRLSERQFITHFNREMLPLSEKGLPVVTFSKDVALHYNNDEIRIIHLPAAHTDGDSAAHFVKNNVIVAGDSIFNGMFPFIDTEHGGSIHGVIASLDTFLALADDNTIIIPGHGGVMSKAELNRYRGALSTILDRIQNAVDGGLSLEDTLALKPTENLDAALVSGVISSDDFVKLVYSALRE